MISYLEGELILKKQDFIIVKSGGVGFKLFVHFDTGTIGEKIVLFTYLVVREDSLSLYGFKTYEELELFETLISVSGIGPKSGMGILSLADPHTIKTAIVEEDPGILTRVSGIGKKTADRVILELKNKFSVDDLETMEGSSRLNVSEHNDAIEALVGIGYGQNEVRKVLAEISKDKSLEERIRLALKELGKGK
jgi:Holliday junction DNA helicase RuvA